ncbi:peptide/nickel transport system ATP-binding protein [Tamaricihabitans halophyticus]|uniref:Peptide/nickel transport system ATP-binding protein n=1 Tax=Tamaricihabitans halophyticus TaxID=1262583 RepID=A0A4R2PV17_9PSEU|nr:ATP-binding cassette domain-containing protein [Tamaricihabitans halophyticus]TCP38928.1 peptide/nickel transport system ATP-binding protein [Tamaricihabitans halophyticus]
MLCANGIVAGYRRNAPVLDGVDVHIASGETVGLAGPSGCGKSTLARVLALLLPPWRGEVSLDGVAITRFRHAAPAAMRTRVGVVFQQPRLAVDPRFTLRQVIAEPVHAAGRNGAVDRTVTDLADRVGLTGDLLNRCGHEVSDGQLQRACLARALAPEPDYLVCDEMTAMVDASTTALLVQVVRSLISERGVGVLAISHDEELLDIWADRVIRLDASGS